MPDHGNSRRIELHVRRKWCRGWNRNDRKSKKNFNHLNEISQGLYRAIYCQLELLDRFDSKIVDDFRLRMSRRKKPALCAFGPSVPSGLSEGGRRAFRAFGTTRLYSAFATEPHTASRPFG